MALLAPPAQLGQLDRRALVVPPARLGQLGLLAPKAFKALLVQPDLLVTLVEPELPDPPDRRELPVELV